MKKLTAFLAVLLLGMALSSHVAQPETTELASFQPPDPLVIKYDGL